MEGSKEYIAYEKRAYHQLEQVSQELCGQIVDELDYYLVEPSKEQVMEYFAHS